MSLSTTPPTPSSLTQNSTPSFVKTLTAQAAWLTSSDAKKTDTLAKITTPAAVEMSSAAQGSYVSSATSVAARIAALNAAAVDAVHSSSSPQTVATNAVTTILANVATVGNTTDSTNADSYNFLSFSISDNAFTEITLDADQLRRAGITRLPSTHDVVQRLPPTESNVSRLPPTTGFISPKSTLPDIVNRIYDTILKGSLDISAKSELGQKILNALQQNGQLIVDGNTKTKGSLDLEDKFTDIGKAIAKSVENDLVSGLRQQFNNVFSGTKQFVGVIKYGAAKITYSLTLDPQGNIEKIHLNWLFQAVIEF
jgi:hypothetical protein